MRKKYLLILTICVIALLVWACSTVFSCSNSGNEDENASLPVDTMSVMVTQIQRCSRLYTAEMKVHKIITHDDNVSINGKLMGKELSINVPTGKRKIAIPLYATIKASIDLAAFTDDDIVKNGEKIQIFLPQPEAMITETHIDHDGVRQYVSLTRSRFSDEELQAYQKKGRDAIEKDMPNLGIDAMARESAARQIIPIVQAMGYEEKNITISFRKDVKNNTIYRHDR